jgi:hypothetical protein
MLDHAAIARFENLDRKASLGGDRKASLGGVGGMMASIGVLEVLGAGLGAFHGYKRNDESVPWAVGWGLLGLHFPILTTAAAFYEGFGQSAPTAGLLEPALKAA